jgi:hypothetical protein
MKIKKSNIISYVVASNSFLFIEISPHPEVERIPPYS